MELRLKDKELAMRSLGTGMESGGKGVFHAEGACVQGLEERSSLYLKKWSTTSIAVS